MCMCFAFHISQFPDPLISIFGEFQIQGCELACLVANWPEEPSGPKYVDLLLSMVRARGPQTKGKGDLGTLT